MEIILNSSITHAQVIYGHNSHSDVSTHFFGLSGQVLVFYDLAITFMGVSLNPPHDNMHLWRA